MSTQTFHCELIHVTVKETNDDLFHLLTFISSFQAVFRYIMFVVDIPPLISNNIIGLCSFLKAFEIVYIVKTCING